MRLFHVIRSGVVLALGCLVFGPVGCRKEVKPGVVYNVSVLTLGKDGKATPQGSVTRMDSAGVGSEQEISHEGNTFSLAIRKTQYGRATFDVTFPDKAVQRVQVKAGQPKDILPRGQKVGVRIEIQESH